MGYDSVFMLCTNSRHNKNHILFFDHAFDFLSTKKHVGRCLKTALAFSESALISCLAPLVNL